MTKFWFVYRLSPPIGFNTTPYQQHRSFLAAQIEAVRLAKKEGTSTFCVLECVGTMGPTNPPIVWTDAT